MPGGQGPVGQKGSQGRKGGTVSIKHEIRNNSHEISITLKQSLNIFSNLKRATECDIGFWVQNLMVFSCILH